MAVESEGVVYSKPFSHLSLFHLNIPERNVSRILTNMLTLVGFKRDMLNAKCDPPL